MPPCLQASAGVATDSETLPPHRLQPPPRYAEDVVVPLGLAYQAGLAGHLRDLHDRPLHPVQGLPGSDWVWGQPGRITRLLPACHPVPRGVPSHCVDSNRHRNCADGWHESRVVTQGKPVSARRGDLRYSAIPPEG